MRRAVVFENDPLIALELQDAIVEAGLDFCGSYAQGSFGDAVLSEIKPDLAIIDLSLGDGESGYKVASSFQESGCKVIIYSGEDAHPAARCQIPHVFVPKPVSHSVIVDVLRRALC